MSIDLDFAHERPEPALNGTAPSPGVAPPPRRAGHRETTSFRARYGGPRSIDGVPLLRRFDTIAPEPVRWLWPGRIALGKLSLIAGEAGLGKSTLTLDLAARVSTGAPWPDGSGDAPRGGVLIVSAEDDPADTIRPRLDAAGADAGRVALLVAIEHPHAGTDETGLRGFTLEDYAPLSDAIGRTPECQLVVIDPATAFLPDFTMQNNAAGLRGLLAPLSKMAGDLGVALVVVTHLNKGVGMSAMQRVTGSGAWVQAARAAYLVGKHPDDEALRVLAPLKNNLAPDLPSLGYRLVAEHEGGVARLDWCELDEPVSAEDLLRPPGPERSGGALEAAREWLREQLHEGARPVSELQAQAQADGLGWRTIQKAKKSLGIQSDRQIRRGAVCWVLPGTREVERTAHGEPPGRALCAEGVKETADLFAARDGAKPHGLAQ